MGCCRASCFVGSPTKAEDENARHAPSATSIYLSHYLCCMYYAFCQAVAWVNNARGWRPFLCCDQAGHTCHIPLPSPNARLTAPRAYAHLLPAALLRTSRTALSHFLPAWEAGVGG